jgi:integrase
MARKATGQVLERKTKRGRVFALRFHAYGERQYLTLGGAWEGWTRVRAEDELANVLADVRRGIWRPATPEPADAGPAPEPTFHEFASAWFDRIGRELRPRTRIDYEWQLTHHLLPFFARHRLSEITVEAVDRYRNSKVREAEDIAAALMQARDGQAELPTIKVTDRRGNAYLRPLKPLSATSINKTITRLGQILEDAVEYGYLDRNPARGKRRRLKASKPAPVWLDRAEHIEALLAAAGQLDEEARADRSHIARRAIIATLVFAGLRMAELTRLRWRDVDLAGNRITVGEAKTDAGTGRIVDLLPVLRDELAAHKAVRTAAGLAAPGDHVFPTSAGRRPSEDNIRDRVFAKTVERANQLLDEAGDVPLPERLTPHKLRHTFASLLVALGVDPGAVMDQLGHTDATFTLRVYRHGMRRSPEAKDALRRLVGGASAPNWGTAAPDLGTGAFSAGAAAISAARH